MECETEFEELLAALRKIDSAEFFDTHWRRALVSVRSYRRSVESIMELRQVNISGRVTDEYDATMKRMCEETEKVRAGRKTSTTLSGSMTCRGIAGTKGARSGMRAARTKSLTFFAPHLAENNEKLGALHEMLSRRVFCSRFFKDNIILTGMGLAKVKVQLRTHWGAGNVKGNVDSWESLEYVHSIWL